MMQRSLFRTLLGACLMGVAGISLTSGVFPMVVANLFEINSYQVLLMVKSFVIPIALFWAVCGGVVSWYGGVTTAGMAMAVVGAITGVILGIIAISGSSLLVLVSVLTGAIYGGIGGLIIGKVFPTPTTQVEEENVD